MSAGFARDSHRICAGFARVRDRTGTAMEVQGCDEGCDFVCTDCAWESCMVMADHHSCCDVRILSDGDVIRGVGNRYLRNPAAGVAKRQRVAR